MKTLDECGGGEDGLEILLGAFPAVALGDRAFLVVGVASGLSYGGISITEGFRSLGR